MWASHWSETRSYALSQDFTYSSNQTSNLGLQELKSQLGWKQKNQGFIQRPPSHPHGQWGSYQSLCLPVQVLILAQQHGVLGPSAWYLSNQDLQYLNNFNGVCGPFKRGLRLSTALLKIQSLSIQTKEATSLSGSKLQVLILDTGRQPKEKMITYSQLV